jgi:hypothetical protein
VRTKVGMVAVGKCVGRPLQGLGESWLGVSVRTKWLEWFWSVHVEVGFYKGTGRAGRRHQ